MKTMCVIMSLVEESDVLEDDIKNSAENEDCEFAELGHTVENLMHALHLTKDKEDN